MKKYRFCPFQLIPYLSKSSSPTLLTKSKQRCRIIKEKELRKRRKGQKKRGQSPFLSYISEEISSKAMFYVEELFLSHSLELANALIGATAIAYGLPILTGNSKHYSIIKDIQVKSFRP